MRNKIHNRTIDDEIVAIKISEIILRAGFQEIALDVLYNCAKISTNINARQQYIQSNIKYSDKYFVSFAEVAEGRYVTYVVEGKKHILHVTREIANKVPGSYFIGKKISDTIKIPQPLTGKFIEGQIVRVTNKYLSLFDDILMDIENPTSGYDILKLEFNSDAPESIFKAFIDNFGLQGSFQLERGKENLAKFYKGEISFSEISLFFFKGNCFDAYFALTSPSFTCFKAIPPTLSIMPSGNDDKLVLDVSALCLLYELSTENNFTFKRKFIVPNSLVETLSEMIYEAQQNPQSDFSITILKDNILPHFKEKDFHEKRVSFLRSIINWTNSNCIVNSVEERINFISGSSENLINQKFWNIQADCRLLIDRPNHYLLTSDTFFIKVLRSNMEMIISPETFLAYDHPDEFKTVQQHLLKKGYVGMTLSHDLIKEEYFKLLAQKENRFSICIENLNYGWNPNPHNVYEIVLFLKDLYLNSYLAVQNKDQTAQSIFSTLIIGMTRSVFDLLKSNIEKEFAILGMWKEHIFSQLLLVLNAKNAAERRV